MLTEIARLARDHFTLRFDYSDRRQEASQRRVEPYRIVNAGLRWYAVCWDLDRDDWRTFRVDRIKPGDVAGSAVQAAPADRCGRGGPGRPRRPARGAPAPGAGRRPGAGRAAPRAVGPDARPGHADRRDQLHDPHRRGLGGAAGRLARACSASTSRSPSRRSWSRPCGRLRLGCGRDGLTARRAAHGTAMRPLTTPRTGGLQLCPGRPPGIRRGPRRRRPRPPGRCRRQGRSPPGDRCLGPEVAIAARSAIEDVVAATAEEEVAPVAASQAGRRPPRSTSFCTPPEACRQRRRLHDVGCVAADEDIVCGEPRHGSWVSEHAPGRHPGRSCRRGTGIDAGRGAGTGRKDDIRPRRAAVLWPAYAMSVAGVRCYAERAPSDTDSHRLVRLGGSYPRSASGRRPCPAGRPSSPRIKSSRRGRSPRSAPGRSLRTGRQLSGRRR